MLKIVLFVFVLFMTCSVTSNTGSVQEDVIDQLNWTSAGTDVDPAYTFSSLSSVYSIQDNGYYEEGSAPESNHTDVNTYNDDFTWKVPVGVHSVDVWIATVEREFSFKLTVTTNDELSFVFSKQDCGGEGGVSVSLNEAQLVNVPGLNDCAGELYYGNGVIGPESYATLGNHWASLRFESTCPKHYTNLKSDFNPILLPDSSLYIVQSEPLIRVNFQLPAYYYEVKSEYVDQCSKDPEQTYDPNPIDGCLNDYTTEINYVDFCNGFVLDSTATNPEDSTEEGYSYSGKLTISAKLDLNVAGFAVTRTVSSPLNWRVFIQKTIEVSSDVTFKNDNVCNTNAECRNNGCCEDGQCNCKCNESGALENVRSGYNGTYCEEDITPPTCDLGHKTVELESIHGGCAKLYTKFVNPNFDDNSGDTYVLRNYTLQDGTTEALTHLFPSDNNDIENMCFGIGEHNIEWHVQDVPLTDPHTENEHAFCSLKITVVDKEAPHVDCQGCQTKSDISSTQAAICTGDSLELGFTRSIVNIADLAVHFNDQKFEDGVFAYPGTVAYNGYIDCNCDYKGENTTAPIVSVITNTWGSWEEGDEGYWTDNGKIRTWDIVNNINLDIDYPTEKMDVDGIPTDRVDKVYPLTYKTTDSSGNSYQCEIGVTYDITEPTCDSFINDNVQVDSSNKNYSLEVDYSSHNWNVDTTISGIDEGPVLTPFRKLQDTYHVGYAYNATYESTYWVTDLAGNNGTCDWRIIVKNPNPCEYPVCDDAKPYLIENTCPSDITITCAVSGDCGCGGWTAPQFADDKFIKKIDVYIDDAFYQTYNNDNSETAHDAPDQKLKIGTTKIAYVAYDMHGVGAEHDNIWIDGHEDHVVMCNFTVKITDHVPPIEKQSWECPSDHTIYTKQGEAVQDYSYDFAYTDECSINKHVYYSGHKSGDTTNSSFTGPHETPLDSFTGSNGLSIGIHTFKYTIKDDQSNSAYCIWKITVVDNEKPVITCPSTTILRQVAQGQQDINIDFKANATDNDAVKSITYTDYEPNDAFSPGEYTITATATDNSGNTDVCEFKIVVEEAYEFATFDAALSSVIVTEITTVGDTERKFGADLIVTTLVNEHHDVKVLEAITNESNNNNGQITGLTAEDRALNEIDGACASDATICVQNFEFTVEFDSCTAQDKSYDLNAQVDCLPTNCTEPNSNHAFTISLAASNYCWQDLASVEVTADFITLDYEDYNNIVTDTSFDALTFTLPTSTKTVFNKNEKVAGLIHVTSDQVQIGAVAITSISQKFYGTSERESNSNSDLAAVLDSYDDEDLGLDYAKVSKDSLAGFSYTEKKLDFKDIFYTTFEATVSVNYNFGSGSRRMLLNTKTQRQLSQDDEPLEKTAETNALMSGSDSNISTGTDSAIIVVKINNCYDASYENELSFAIAKYLHIDTSRVSTEVEATAQGYCLAEVNISQSKCAGNIDILTLIQYLQEGTQDSFSELHTYFTEGVSSDVSLDSNVFFVSQTPSAIYETASISSSNSDTTSSTAWYFYVAAGVVIGMIIVNVMYSKYNNKSEKSVKHQPLQAERRYSIADLLAATERRSSIDVANVRLHSAF